MTDNNQPSISIIIVNYNGKALLRSCLESVCAQSIEDIEIILVDNGSGDGSAEYLREHFSHVLTIAFEKKWDFLPPIT
jgi:glycosyltransferase involved in cell wall biosynthesis